MDMLKAWFEMGGAIFKMLLLQVEFGALVVGTFAAIAITQSVKMMVIQYAPTNGGRGLWYMVTLVIGALATVSLWPTVLGFWWGVVAGGLFAPIIYMAGTRTIYRFYPDLEQRISATPRVR